MQKLWENESDPVLRSHASKLKEITGNNGPITTPWDDVFSVRCEAPVLRDLDKEATATPARNLADVLRCIVEGQKIEGGLPWKEPKTLADDFLAKVGPGVVKTAMLVGDKRYGAVYESKEVFAGLMHLPPHVNYPEHAHDATETWTILYGESEWNLGTAAKEDRLVRPGEHLHIESGVGHAVKTHEAPLLAFYIWTGEVYGRYWFVGASLEKQSHKPTERPDP